MTPLLRETASDEAGLSVWAYSAHCFTGSRISTPYCCVQGVLNWVADPAPGRSPPRIELRLYDVLFRYWARIPEMLFPTRHIHMCPMCLHSCDEQPTVTAVKCSSPDPANEEDWLSCLNPNSLEVVTGGLASPPLVAAQPGDRCASRTPVQYASSMQLHAQSGQGPSLPAAVSRGRHVRCGAAAC